MTKIDLFFEKLKQVSLSSAIALLAPFTVHYAIQMIRTEPSFIFSQEKEITEIKALINSLEEERKGLLGATVPLEITTSEGKFCWDAHFIGNDQGKYNDLTQRVITGEQTIKKLENLSQKEQDTWEQTVKHDYNKKYFFSALFIGLLTLLMGLVYEAGSIGLGLIFGGLLTILVGYFHFWKEMSPFLKFLSLLVSIVIIIYRGTTTYKRLNKE